MIRNILSKLPFAALVMFAFAAAAADENGPPQFGAAELEFFEKEVRPILAERCYECHSAKIAEPKGSLRLDSRAAILAGGDTGPAAEPGNPGESLLIDAVNYGDTYQMPPKSKLPEGEIAILTKWVKVGAPWPEEAPPVAANDSHEFDLESRKEAHWAWQPMAKQAPPQVQDTQWPRHDLDRFILARLEAVGLTPAPEADRRALIRRVSFDLTGLPPTPEEVEAFVNDASPQAFETVVDRLLDSPHFGERWARHWMDLVRYAETYGHEFDFAIPQASRYRDYLIRAFNADVPYDRLILEHIAGDLLGDPRLHPTEGFDESPIGAGFWFLGEATHAPVDVRGDEAGRVDNQLDVMSKTFLAMTVACARCHDHKFDAISTKDYYALAGFLQSSRRHEAMLDPHGKIAAVAAQLREMRARGDEVIGSVVVEPAEDVEEQIAGYLTAVLELYGQEDVDVEAFAVEQQLDTDRLNAWLSAIRSAEAAEPAHPLYLWRRLADRDGEIDAEALAELRAELRKQVNAANSTLENMPLIADFAGDTYGGWLAYGEAFGHGPTSGCAWDRNDESVAALPAGVAHSGAVSKKLRGVLHSPTFTITHENLYYRVAGRDCQVRLVVDGYFMNSFSELLFKGFKFDVKTDGRFVWHRQAEDVGRYIGHRAHVEVIDDGDGYVAIDEIRFSSDSEPPSIVSPIALNALGDEQVDTLPALAKRYADEFTAAQRSWRAGDRDNDQAQLVEFAVRQRLVDVDPAAEEQLCSLAAQMAELEATTPEPLSVLSIVDGSGENERVHIRGNHKTLGDEAPRRMLAALGGAESSAIEQGSGRLLLARQIADPTNPLTARVMVNRVWHHLFGRGIVASVDNFGVLGQTPTHPELLDFLALEFVREGWSIKRLIRTLVLSSTYRMSSAAHDPRGAEVDPQNLLLHRMRIRRLEGEAVRDAILAVSGRLDPTLFGPSTPVHLTEFMQGRGRPKESGPLDGDGRRSLYTIVRRNFLPPMMLAFDTPAPFSTVGRRNVSNVPAQALILMNDPFVVEQCEIWARRLLREAPQSTEQRIERMYELALARPPSNEETAAAREFLRAQADAYEIAFEEHPADIRLWTDLCHVMLNVKEFIFVR